MAGPTMQLRLSAVSYKAEGVLEFELRDPAGHALPAFTSGAHIDLHLQEGIVRSYSLCNATRDVDRYLIAVGLEAKSRGGSLYLHEKARVGSLITASAPRNSFPLVKNAAHTLLLAGGIGVTPIWSMAQRLTELGQSWALFYAARSRRSAAYVAELERLAGRCGARANFHFDDVEGKPPNLRTILANAGPTDHAYCCGPASMIDAFRNAADASGIGSDQVHVELFKAAVQPANSQDNFDISLQRSGRVLRVHAGRSILDTLLDAKVEIPYSCMEGICGSCQLKVIEGVPDHRDSVLSSRERAANDVIIACCSRSKSQLLTLDL